MARQIQIDLVINADGEMLFEVEGMKGRGCHQLTREIAEALDAEVLDLRNTSEFYQAEATINTSQQTRIDGR